MEEFYEKNNWRGPLTVIGEYTLIAIAITIAINYPNPWLYPVYVIFVGTRMYALAEAMTHEAVHRNLCKNKKLNDFFGYLTTCLLYTSPSPRDKRQSRMPSSA